jgi:hypothetical protein
MIKKFENGREIVTIYLAGAAGLIMATPPEKGSKIAAHNESLEETPARTQ